MSVSPGSRPRRPARQRPGAPGSRQERVGDDELSEATTVKGERDHRVAHGHVHHPLPRGARDRAPNLHPRHERPLAGVPGRAATREHVGEVQSRVGHLDQNLTGAGRRESAVSDPQDARVPGLDHLESAHAATLVRRALTDDLVVRLAPMRTSRLEAFSDGVLAIIITIMVLELKVPEEPTFSALGASATGFLTYLLSFVYVGIYWSNHHHMFQLVQRVDGRVLWANLHLLLWLSLFPVTTAWVDESAFSRTPVIVYGVNLLLAAVAYYALQLVIFRVEGGSGLRQALGRDLKGGLLALEVPPEACRSPSRPRRGRSPAAGRSNATAASNRLTP